MAYSEMKKSRPDPTKEVETKTLIPGEMIKKTTMRERRQIRKSREMKRG